MRKDAAGLVDNANQTFPLYVSQSMLSMPTGSRICQVVPVNASKVFPTRDMMGTFVIQNSKLMYSYIRQDSVHTHDPVPH